MMDTRQLFNLDFVHSSWRNCLQDALSKMNANYLNSLYNDTLWLPGHDKIFNAFSLPVDQVNFVLFGESPYPRAQSANGYAFWDAAVKNLWNSTGLTKEVNRATSLRNFIKMLLLADGKLDKNHLSQPDIANLNKEKLVQTNQELFQSLLNHGFLLLNATLVLQEKKHKDAREWMPFLQHVLHFLCEQNSSVSLILFGNIAKEIEPVIPSHCTHRLYAEHPYNLSFICNPKVLDFFRPLHLLSR